MIRQIAFGTQVPEPATRYKSMIKPQVIMNGPPYPDQTLS